jgi:uncharacterized phosphosugar-binding protein
VLNDGFLPRLMEILRELSETQRESFAAAAERMADTLERGGLVHLFGSGHSVIPVMDAFPRYGSFVGLNPLTDPRLMWSNVLGPGGVRELLWLERTEGYIERYLSHEAISPGDTLIVFSHGGRNAAPVEAAMYGRDQGATVIGVTSTRNLARPAEHSSGKRLAEVSDVVLDTGVPVEDALVVVEGWPAPVAAASSIVACACVGELVARTAERLAARGITLPTFVSPTVPGASVASNDHVFTAHQERLHEAAGRESVVSSLPAKPRLTKG